MGKFFDTLKEGLEEAVEYEKGKKLYAPVLLNFLHPPKTTVQEQLSASEPS